LALSHPTPCVAGKGGGSGSFRASLEQTIEQALGFLFHGEDVGADGVQRAQGLRLVEMACEANFVADFGGICFDPGVIGQLTDPHLLS